MIKKVSITTGTRSEYGLLRPIIKKISQNKKLKLYLIVAGMHLSKKYGMTVNEIKNDGFKISATVNMVPKNDSAFNMSDALGKGIRDFSKIFQKIEPNINLILGDRDEAFASAIAASHMNIPNAHIHGGDKSRAGIDEYNRHAITKLSNIHFAATKKSANRILRMGENSQNIFHTGSPSIDEVVNNKITKIDELKKKYGNEIIDNEILLVQHSVTTEIDDAENQINQTLKAITKLQKNTIIIGANIDSGNQIIHKKIKQIINKHDFIHFYPTLPRNDFLGLLQNCKVLVGNSSSGIIEASFFKKPVVNIGIRQKFREKGPNVIDVKQFTHKSICNAIENALQSKTLKQSSIYGQGHAAKKIIKHLEEIKLNTKLLQKQITY